MPALVDLKGNKLGLLAVLQRDANGADGRPRWLCKCDCGRTTIVSASNLRSGKTRSCGCLVNGSATVVHGKCKTPTYEIWKSMRSRCNNSSNKSWARYGGRGITVCDRWNDFQSFYADMGEAPKRMALERIDNDGPYSPENCRWASYTDQARNKSNNSGFKHNGVFKIWAEWAEEGAVSQQLLRSRVVVWRWDFEEALRTPPTR